MDRFGVESAESVGVHEILHHHQPPSATFQRAVNAANSQS
jgi:hypothetical protein